MRVFADDVVHRVGGGIRERTFQATQRVVRNVQAQHVTLKVQLLAAIPIGHVRDGHGQLVTQSIVHAEGTEEVELARRLFTLDRHGSVHCRLVDEGQGTAGVTQVVECARLDERFNGALIAHLQRHLLQEVVEGLVTALLLAGGNHTLDHVRAHVTNCTHTEADIIADRGKRQGGLVHVRGEHGNAHGTALIQVQCELVLVIAHTGQQSSHVLLREVRLQVRSPVRHQTVRSRVRLVERVVRERQQNIPERLNSALRVAVRNHAVVEGGVLLIQLRLLLLTHRTAQQVCLTQSVVRDLLSNRHNLLLIHNQAVGGVQNVLQRLFQLGVNRLDLLLTVLTQRVVGMRVRTHRARTVQRQHCRNVLELLGLHELQERAHRATIELEHAEGVAARQQTVGFRVIQRQRFKIQVNATVRLNILHSIGDDGEVTQAQEVHLDQAQALTGGVIELGDDLAVRLAAHHRDDVHEVLAGHNHARSVHTPLTLQTLQALRGLEHLAVNLIDRVLNEGAQICSLGVTLILFVVHVRQGDVLTHDVRRHRLGEALADRVRLIHHAGGVLERLLRLNGAEGDNLCDLLFTVLFGHVVDDFAAATIVKVHIEVGHGDAVGVEESLENQVVVERVQVGNTHRVCDHGARTGTTARTHANTVTLSPVDKVGDHEEVAGEAHGGNNPHLVFSLLAHLVGHAVREAVVQALLDLLHEPGFLVFALGHGEVRHVVRLGVELHVAAFSDFEGVLARAGNVAEQGVHFFCRAQVEVIRVELETLGVGEGRAGLHAQQRRVGGVVFLAGVVQIVGGDEGQVQLLGEAVQIFLDIAFNVQAVVHDLAVEVVLTENIAEFARSLDRLVELAQAQASLNLAGGAASGRNQALRVGLQHLTVHTRLVQLTFQRRNRGGTEQVVHALGGFSPHGHMGVRAATGDVVAGAVAPAHTRTVGTVRAGGQVRFHTNDGLNVVRFSLTPEVEGTKEEAVVAGRHGLHAEFFSVGEQVTQARGTVEHRVLGVHVQVRKFFGCHGYLLKMWAGGWAVNVKLCAAARGRL